MEPQVIKTQDRLQYLQSAKELRPAFSISPGSCQILHLHGTLKCLVLLLKHIVCNMHIIVSLERCFFFREFFCNLLNTFLHQFQTFFISRETDKYIFRKELIQNCLHARDGLLFPRIIVLFQRINKPIKLRSIHPFLCQIWFGEIGHCSGESKRMPGCI